MQYSRSCPYGAERKLMHQSVGQLSSLRSSEPIFLLLELSCSIEQALLLRHHKMLELRQSTHGKVLLCGVSSRVRIRCMRSWEAKAYLDEPRPPGGVLTLDMEDALHM